MKDNLLIIFAFTLIMFTSSNANHAQAQYDLDYGFAAGTGHYLGDIGGKEQIGRNFVSDLHLGSTRFSSHVFVRSRIHDMVALRGQLGIVQIAGDDAVSPMPRGLRNIHFRNFVNELSVRTEVSVWNQPFLTRRTSKVQMGLDTYLTLGLTGFTHAPQVRLDRDAAEYHFVRGNISTNPNLFDYDRWYDLRSVQTEPESYRKTSLGFPVGGGVAMTINNDLRIGLEFVWNLTLTDYLDDVSTTYNDPSNLTDLGVVLSAPWSAELYAQLDNSPRDGDEIDARLDYREGRIRGNPNKNDTYGTLQVTVSKVLKTKSSFATTNYSNAGRGNFGGTKHRAFRAKF